MPTAPRRRSAALAGSDADDISPAGLAKIDAAGTKDKMVMVSIARDFTLTGDDHKPVHYKAGIDTMPLSHANHWFAINAGGVKLYTKRRADADAVKAQEDVAPSAVLPPKGDPDKMPSPSPDLRLGVDPQSQTPNFVH